jgi:Tfp pilus assembly protein PilZ
LSSNFSNTPKEQRLKYEANNLYDTIIPDIHYDGKIYNLSDGDIYFESDEQILAGDEISITVRKLNGTEQSFDAEILWRKKLQNSFLCFGYGARLIEPKNTFVQILDPEELQGTDRINSAKDSRKYKRQINDKKVRFKCQNNYYRGRIKNISRGGAFIETKFGFFLIGEKVVLNIPGMNTRKNIKLIGWIARCNDSGFGIQFNRRSKMERPYDIRRGIDPDRVHGG